MTPDRWRQIEQLYHSALEREPTDRAAFLRDACAGDDSLLQEIQSLLTQETATARLMEIPALEAAAMISNRPPGQSIVGRQVGSYQVISLLGVGGMGEVYEARDTKLGRAVAIKVLPTEFIHDPDRLARFQREAKMLASLNHPNIATIHGLEQFEGVHYLVMELIPGKTLAERITKAALPLEEALRLAGQIAEALEVETCRRTWGVVPVPQQKKSRNAVRKRIQQESPRNRKIPRAHFQKGSRKTALLPAGGGPFFAVVSANASMRRNEPASDYPTG